MKDKNRGLIKSLNILAKSSIIVFIAVVLSKILTYIYRIVIVRMYGPEIYGVFSLAVIIFSLLTTLSTFGLFEGLLRYIPFYRGKKKFKEIAYLFKKTLIVLSIISIFTGILLFIFADIISIQIFHNQELTPFLKIFSFLIPFSILSGVFLATLLAFEKIVWNAFILNFLQNFIKLVFIVFFVFIGMNTEAIIYSFALGIISVFIASFLVSKYYLPKIYLKISLPEKTKNKIVKEVITYSLPLLFSSFLASILYSTDSFIIGYFKSTAEVGLYNIAVPIAMLLSFAPDLFIRLFFPLITKSFSNKNYSMINELSKQVEKWILMLNVPLFLIIIVFPGAIINFLFGANSFVPGMAGDIVLVLQMLSVGALFTSLQSIPMYMLSTLGKSKLILTNIIVGGLINLALNIILIQKYGITGAAFSTMIVSIFICISYFLQVKHYFSFIPIRKKVINIFFAGILSLLILVAAREFISVTIVNMIILLSIFLISYMLLIFLTHSLDDNDKKIIINIKRGSFASRFIKSTS